MEEGRRIYANIRKAIQFLLASNLAEVLAIFFAFGFSFELPVAMVILVLLGWVTPQQLRDGRGYAVVGIFVVAAVLTPPDVVSQLMLAIPMCLLYEVGILGSRWFVRISKAPEEGEQEAS